MPSLCDVNFLLALCHERHEHYPVAMAKLAATSAAGQMVVCRASQLGLLRLLSNSAVMRESVCTTDEAWQVHDTLMADDRFSYRDEPAGLQAKMREFTKGFPFSPKLWQDAYLAAFAIGWMAVVSPWLELRSCGSTIQSRYPWHLRARFFRDQEEWEPGEHSNHRPEQHRIPLVRRLPGQNLGTLREAIH